MLRRLPIERSVYIDFEKISGTSDSPEEKTFIMTIDGQLFIFSGKDYEPVKKYVLSVFDGKTFEQIENELWKAGSGNVLGSFGGGSIWIR